MLNWTSHREVPFNTRTDRIETIIERHLVALITLRHERSASLARGETVDKIEARIKYTEDRLAYFRQVARASRWREREGVTR